MDLVNDGRWLFKSLGEKLEGKDGGSSVMARAGGCQASPLINPNIIKRKTPGSYTVLMGGLRKFMPPVTYYCKKKKKPVKYYCQKHQTQSQATPDSTNLKGQRDMLNGTT